MRKYPLDVRVFIGDNYRARQDYLLATMRMAHQIWAKERDFNISGSCLFSDDATRWLKERGLRGSFVEQIVDKLFYGKMNSFADFFLEGPEMGIPTKHIESFIELLIGPYGPQTGLWLSTESDIVVETLKLAFIRGEIQSLEFIHIFEGEDGKPEAETFTIDNEGTLNSWPDGLWMECLHLILNRQREIKKNRD